MMTQDMAILPKTARQAYKETRLEHYENLLYRHYNSWDTPYAVLEMAVQTIGDHDII
jgi:hypothetical protein